MFNDLVVKKVLFKLFFPLIFQRMDKLANNEIRRPGSEFNHREIKKKKKKKKKKHRKQIKNILTFCLV